MLPLGAERAAKVAFRRGPATAMPRQFGPIRRAPWARTSASNCSCRSAPSLPTSANPAEITTSARTPLRSASSAAASTCSPGTAITARSTGSGISATEAYPRTPATAVTLRVHRVGGPREVTLEHVAEQLTADRPAPGRCPDDGDARGLEERAQRRDHRGVIALLDTQLEPLGQPNRELHLDHAARKLACQLEASPLEHTEHRPVLRQHLGDEALDPDRCGTSSEPLEEPRPDPSPLLVVGDGERGLRQRRIAQTHVVADRDDPLPVLIRQRTEQRTALDPIRLQQRLDELRPQVREAVEAAVQALTRKRLVEVEQRLAVGGSRRAQAKRSTVAEDHVDRVACGCRHGAH